MGGRDENELLQAGELPLDPAEGCEPFVPEGEREADPTKERLPLELFPAWFSAVVRAIAATKNAPEELAAVPCMTAVASALGPTWFCGPKSFSRSPAIWGAVVAPSGNAKSPTARGAFKEVKRYDRKLREEQESAPDAPLRRRRAFVTDTTVEALVAELQLAEGHGLLVLSDELDRLLGGLDGQAGGRRGRPAWLSLWSGEAIRLTRKTSDSAEVDNPFVVVFGGVQPSVLGRLKLQDGDGLAARFLWSHAVGRAHRLGQDLPLWAAERWRQAMELAYAHGASANQPFCPAGREVLSDSLLRWTGRANELEAAGLGLMASVYGKAGDQCVRLTALLHGLDAIGESIGGAPMIGSEVPSGTVERAVALTDYFMRQGQETVRLVTAPDEQAQDSKSYHQDLAVAEALKKLVGRGAVEDLTAGWARRLVAAGVELKGDAPKLVGRSFRRLAALQDGLVVERCQRTAKGRKWRICGAAPGRK